MLKLHKPYLDLSQNHSMSLFVSSTLTCSPKAIKRQQLSSRGKRAVICKKNG